MDPIDFSITDSKPFSIIKTNNNNSLLEKRSHNDLECREELGDAIQNNKQKQSFQKRSKKEDKQIVKEEAKLQNEYGNFGEDDQPFGNPQQYNMQQSVRTNNLNNINNQQARQQRGGTVKKTPQEYQRQYDQENFKYVNEGFTVQSNYYIKRIASDTNASQIACKYPLYKMIRSIVKKFLFNELEIVFFAYILEENRWKIDDEHLKMSAFQMKDFLNITEVKDPLDYKTVLLYLVLNAYAVKFYLNDSATLEMFKQHLEGIVPKFKETFQVWSKTYAQNSLKINPKQMNKIFRKLSDKPSQGKNCQEDYNSLVDAIIQISPPYNNEKEPKQEFHDNNMDQNNSRQNNGNKQPVEPRQHQQQQQQQKEDNDNDLPVLNNKKIPKPDDNQNQQLTLQQQQSLQQPQLKNQPSSHLSGNFPFFQSEMDGFPNILLSGNKFGLDLVKNQSMQSEKNELIEDFVNKQSMLQSFNPLILQQQSELFGQTLLNQPQLDFNALNLQHQFSQQQQQFKNNKSQERKTNKIVKTNPKEDNNKDKDDSDNDDLDPLVMQKGISQSVFN